jgi:hypothetical protein
MAARDETGAGRGVGRTAHRHTTETKASFKTSEFAAYIAVVLGVLIAGVVVSGEGSDPDGFSADQVWLYITILTFGYMVSRGIAKAGSREAYTDDDH